MAVSELSEAISEAFEVELPERLLRFHEKQEWEDCEYLHLREGFLRGWFEPVFDDEDYLADLDAIGEDFGIDDMDDLDWSEEFADFVPLAILEEDSDDDDDDDGDVVGAFLVVQISDPECPVWVWDQDGWMIYPLAASLDDFLAGVAWEGKQPVEHARAGHPYSAFEWVDDVPDDEGDDDD